MNTVLFSFLPQPELEKSYCPGATRRLCQLKIFSVRGHFSSCPWKHSNSPSCASLHADRYVRQENGPLDPLPSGTPTTRKHPQSPFPFSFKTFWFSPHHVGCFQAFPSLLCQAQRCGIFHLRTSPEGNSRESLRLQVPTLKPKPRPTQHLKIFSSQVIEPKRFRE